MSIVSKDNVTLGSGKLYIDEYTGTLPDISSIINDSTKRLGAIKGGCSVEYTKEKDKETDDLGELSVTKITAETVILKSGVLTWNGTTLQQLCSTARVSTSGTKRTVKIGGIENDDGKSYIIIFVSYDLRKIVYIVGKNGGGFTFSFAKDAATVIDVEFEAEPMDDDGTLLVLEEETSTDAKKSTDLSALTGLTLSPVFSNSNDTYTAETTESTNTITATAKNSDATVTIMLGDTEVESGSAATWADDLNILTVIVENGTKKRIITIEVTKKSA